MIYRRCLSIASITVTASGGNPSKVAIEVETVSQREQANEVTQLTGPQTGLQAIKKELLVT